jgi:hypothetical protein
MYVIGLDPGPIPGVVCLQLADQQPTHLVTVGALQVTPGLLIDVLDMLAGHAETTLALERFVVGPRAARSSTPAAGALTRDMIYEVGVWAGEHADYCWRRSAAEVKPWATDARLDAAGLLSATTGMRHARDAARHALFSAVKDWGLPDPLSARAGAR